MGRVSPVAGWPFPFVTEDFSRQSIEDLAKAIDATLHVRDAGRKAALQRPTGCWRAGAGTMHFPSTQTADTLVAFDPPAVWGPPPAAGATEVDLPSAGVYRVDVSYRRGFPGFGSTASLVTEIELDGVNRGRRKHEENVPLLGASWAVAILAPASLRLRVKVWLAAPETTNVAITEGRLQWTRLTPI